MPKNFPVLVLPIALVINLAAHASDFLEPGRKDIQHLGAANCVKVANQISKTFDGLEGKDYQQLIKASSHRQLLEAFWSFKIGLHEKMRSLYQEEKKIERDCGDAIRHAFRSIRYAEDTISEHFYRHHSQSVKFPDHAFAKDNEHVRSHPKFSDFKLSEVLRTGDIILSRGNAFTSAAISSLGEFDTQFSHISLVYRDQENKLWTVEAHIEVGSFVRPLEEHIEDKNFRTMIYRFDDPKVAAKAAELIFHKVKKASDTKGNILYDFGFNQDESTKLFCSEIVSHAYELGSENLVQLPYFRSRLMVRKPNFVRMLGIEVEKSFIPADIEVDPRFTVVAEWRDAARTLNIMQKDAVLQAMFHWNDVYDYRMIQASSKKSLLYRNVAWPLRRVPYLKKYFKDKLPINMSRKLIGYFGVLDSVGELLQTELKISDEAAIKETGFPLFRAERYDFLNEVRLKDLSNKKKKLHKMYRPPKTKS